MLFGMETAHQILIGAAAAVIVAAAVIIWLVATRSEYNRQTSIMSDAESYFYLLVDNMLPSGYRLFPQTPLSAVFAVRKKSRHYMSRFNKISAKRADYCICRENRTPGFPYLKLEIVALIELDDRSHERKDRRKRDKFVNRLCKKCGVPMLRFASRSNKNPDYDEQYIRREISKALS
jgi:hypothetical protein